MCVNFDGARGVIPAAGVFDTETRRVKQTMFCPRCGQQQISEEVRFCPRCGLSLAQVPTLLASGIVPAAADVPRVERTQKRLGIRRGAKVMFFSAVLFPIFLGISIAADSPGPLVIPFTVFLAGLAWLLYFVLFGEEVPRAGEVKGRKGLRDSHTAPALPPSTFVPASGFGQRRANTADMAQPPSVTEQTTRLLDEE